MVPASSSTLKVEMGTWAGEQKKWGAAVRRPWRCLEPLFGLEEENLGCWQAGILFPPRTLVGRHGMEKVQPTFLVTLSQGVYLVYLCLSPPSLHEGGICISEVLR